jgi:hypothetical protein
MVVELLVIRSDCLQVLLSATAKEARFASSGVGNNTVAALLVLRHGVLRCLSCALVGGGRGGGGV